LDAYIYIYIYDAWNHEPKIHPGIGGKIILNWILKKWDNRAWTGLIVAKNRVRWWAVMNAVLNL
jgi:hypothetical protein